MMSREKMRAIELTRLRGASGHPRHRCQCPASVPLTGFQPSLIGRFWASRRPRNGAHYCGGMRVVDLATYPGICVLQFENRVLGDDAWPAELESQIHGSLR